jgi:FMN phosphatase YigB (HAD superfamily)
MAEKVILFDMDGTLADYDSAMYQDLYKLRAPDDPSFDMYGPAVPMWAEARMDLIKRQPGWWKNLKKNDLGFQILTIAQFAGFEDIHILTKGPRSKPQAWAEKLEWCHEHLEPYNVKVTITEDKGLTYGRVLVDDFPPYVERWLEHRPRGIVIMPKNTSNANFVHPQVHLYDGTDKYKLCKLLYKAYNR